MYQVIKNTYRNLLKQGWRLNQIDESDIFFLYDLLGEDKQKEMIYANQVPWL